MWSGHSEGSLALCAFPAIAERHAERTPNADRTITGQILDRSLTKAFRDGVFWLTCDLLAPKCRSKATRVNLHSADRLHLAGFRNQAGGCGPSRRITEMSKAPVGWFPKSRA